MKTLKETMEALDGCLQCTGCYGCPYDADPLPRDTVCHNAVRDALAHIKQLESQIPRWIPVEEMLPEKFVVLKYEYSNELLVYDGQNIRLAYYCHTTDAWHNAENEDETVDVTHWMPLPEPPTKEDKK